jgi:hypothetical protein
MRRPHQSGRELIDDLRSLRPPRSPPIVRQQRKSQKEGPDLGVQGAPLVSSGHVSRPVVSTATGSFDVLGTADSVCDRLSSLLQALLQVDPSDTRFGNGVAAKHTDAGSPAGMEVVTQPARLIIPDTFRILSVAAGCVCEHSDCNILLVPQGEAWRQGSGS